MPGEGQNRFWVVFGKISAVLTAAAAVIVIVLAFKPNGPELVAVCRATSFALPPNLIHSIEAIQSSQTTASLRDEFEIRFSGEELRICGDWDLLDALQNRYKRMLPQSFLHRRNPYEELWTIAVENRGNHTAEDVVIDVPFDGIALITRRDDTQETQDFSKRIVLSEIRADEFVGLSLWAEGPLFRSSRDLKITHKSGIGKVRKASTVYGSRATIARNIGFISLMAFLALLLILPIAASGLFEKKATVASQRKQRPSKDRTYQAVQADSRRCHGLAPMQRRPVHLVDRVQGSTIRDA